MEKESYMSSAVPLGVFWDMETCHVPKGCSAFDLIASIRSMFLTNKSEEEFFAVGDVLKQPANILNQLDDAQVIVVHADSTRNNSADKLRQLMRRYAETQKTPASLIIISGDIQYARDLHEFRYRKRLDTILIHPQKAAKALIASASTAYQYTQFTDRLPQIITEEISKGPGLESSMARPDNRNETPPPPYSNTNDKPDGELANQNGKPVEEMANQNVNTVEEVTKENVKPFEEKANQDVDTVPEKTAVQLESVEKSEKEARAVPYRIDTADLSESTFSFVFHDLEKLKNYAQSPPHFVRNLPWRIRVKPIHHKGIKYLGFYLVCNTENETTEWSCQAAYELRLLSHEPDGEAYVGKSNGARSFESNFDSWGFIKFIKWSDVLNPQNGYIKDNAVTFEVYISAEVPHGASFDSSNDCWERQ